MQTLYTLDGRSKLFKKSQVAAQLKAGWYDEPMQTLYSSDGKSKLFKKSQVAAQLKVGWYTEPVKLVMNATEARNASDINWIVERNTYYYPEENLYRVFFGFRITENGNEVYAPAFVKIRIVNDSNETVYTSSTIVNKNNFSNWSSDDKTNYLASVKIPTNTIKPGKSRSGKLYFSVKNPGYFNFEECSITINGLPKKGDPDAVRGLGGRRAGRIRIG